VPGFADAVRKYILHVLGITFQHTNKSTLGSALSLDNKALDNLVCVCVALLVCVWLCLCVCVCVSVTHIPHYVCVCVPTQIKERVKSHGWVVQKELVTLPKNELNSPVVVKRTQVCV